jgi:hypothetical protein
MTTRTLLACLVLCGSGPSQVLGQSTAAPAVPYSLSPDSHYEAGCFAPCMCPVLVRESVNGGFALMRVGSENGYDLFEVSDLDWVVPGTSELRVKGSGLFRMDSTSGKQRMTLDLVIDSNPSQRFDSGLVPVGAAFPLIDVAVAIHGFYCSDTAFTIQAKSAVAGLPGGDRPTPLLGPARPNPFRSNVDITVEIPAAGRTDLRIYDALGREVRDLVADEWLEAGSRRLTWDGRRDDGTRSPAGLYYARLRSLDGADSRILVKVE